MALESGSSKFGQNFFLPEQILIFIPFCTTMTALQHIAKQ